MPWLLLLFWLLWLLWLSCCRGHCGFCGHCGHRGHHSHRSYLRYLGYHDYVGNYGYLRYLSVRANTAIFVAVATIAILAIMAFRANMASCLLGFLWLISVWFCHKTVLRHAEDSMPAFLLLSLELQPSKCTPAIYASLLSLALSGLFCLSASLWFVSSYFPKCHMQIKHWRWRGGGGAFILSKRSNFQLLVSVFGGVLFTQCGGQAPAFQGISFRDGTGLLQNPGIFRNWISLIFLSQDSLEMVRDFSGLALYRVRKSKNFPDSKISTAKTFRIKCANRDIDHFATNARKT